MTQLSKGCISMGLHWGLEELVDKKISVTFADLSIYHTAGLPLVQRNGTVDL